MYARHMMALCVFLLKICSDVSLKSANQTPVISEFSIDLLRRNFPNHFHRLKPETIPTDPKGLS